MNRRAPSFDELPVISADNSKQEENGPNFPFPLPFSPIFGASARTLDVCAAALAVVTMPVRRRARRGHYRRYLDHGLPPREANCSSGYRRPLNRNRQPRLHRQAEAGSRASSIAAAAFAVAVSVGASRANGGGGSPQNGAGAWRGIISGDQSAALAGLADLTDFRVPDAARRAPSEERRQIQQRNGRQMIRRGRCNPRCKISLDGNQRGASTITTWRLRSARSWLDLANSATSALTLSRSLGADLLMRHFAATVAQGDLDLVAFLEEPLASRASSRRNRDRRSSAEA